MSTEKKDDHKAVLKELKELRQEATSWNEEIKATSASQRRETIKDLQETLSYWKKQFKENEALKEQAGKIVKLAKSQLGFYKEQATVLGRIKQEGKVTMNNLTNFLQNTAVQYNYAQKIAKEYKTISRDIGASNAMGARLSETFRMSLSEVENLGGGMEDITNMMTSFAEQSGRVRILDKEDVLDIEEIAKGTNMVLSNAAQMAETFDLMGVSMGSMKDNLQDTFTSAQKMGLNANKVMKVLQQNMKSMQSYSFAGGVKGMTEMAKQAVKMRLDVSDVLQMADKFYQPEAAIEAAANLQMLGGDIAEAFGDPFETMYLARNKPEELAKRLGEMTENMMTFNEETGGYEFPAEVRMQLKAVEGQLGINVDKLTTMARQTSKLKDLKMKFTAIGDEEKIEALTSLAKYSEDAGGFVVEHKGEEFGLDEIGDGMADEILKANQPQEQTFKDIAINTQTMSEQMVSLNESMMARVSGEVDLYGITAKQIEKNIFTPMKTQMEKATTTWIKNFKPEDIFDEEAAWGDVFGGADAALGLFTAQVSKGVTSLKDLNKLLAPEAPGPNKEEDASGTEVKITKPKPDFISRPGRPMEAFVPEDTVLGAKKGGPIDKLLDGSITMDNNSSRVSGSIDVNFNNAVITLKSSSGEVAMDMNKIKDVIQPIIINALNNKSRNGGVLSSKEALDNGLTV
jgi:hypothetical protein